MTTDFNLRQVIREVLRSSTMADPGQVADEVMRRIPTKMIKAALTQVLRDVVRQVMSEERGAHRGLTPTAGPTRSAKVSGIRDGWQKRLRDRVHVGASEWKLLGSCTYDDLLFAASERREIAESNAAMARQYDAWARLINKHDVATFGDLPAEAQMSALGRAA